MGYAGGTVPDPNYYKIADYSETVQVDYDPAIVSYAQLLEAFWSGHDAGYPYSRQYRSAVFYSTEEQKKAAFERRQRVEARLGKPVFTDIEALTQFYVAEDYHQKYYLRGTPELLEGLSRVYPNPEDMVDSTAAARLNGYVAGYGDPDVLRKELGKLGLSEAGKKMLLDITASGLVLGCAVPYPGE